MGTLLRRMTRVNTVGVRAAAAAAALLVGLSLGGCGSKSKSPTAASPTSTASTTATTGTTTTATTPAAAIPATGIAATTNAAWAHLVLSAYPQSLDPGADRSTQGAMINWLIYTGLTTYRRAAGNAGEQLIAGLATTLPQISDNGQTYTFTLRSGVVYSNGTSVRAADFAYTVERAIKIGWPGAPFYLTDLIVGAAAYSSGHATAISGIKTDDSSGRIVIHLTRRFDDFANVLAMPALGLVPTGTPMSVQSTPPAGAGPYVLQNAIGSQSFDLIINPHWDPSKVPGVPAAKTDIAVDVDSGVASNGLSLLNNTSDLTDPSDMLPASLLGELKRLAPTRIRTMNLGTSTDLIFMNTREAPFSSQLAREAVVTALSRTQLAQLGSGSGTLTAGCFLLPPAVIGHPTNATCPYGDGSGDIAKARKLVTKSGQRGQKVTVYSPTRGQYVRWMNYYAQVLNEIGFKATVTQIPDSSYLSQIYQAKQINPQTGVLDWTAGFPGATDFYSQLLDSQSLHSWGNLNLSQVDDTQLDRQIAALTSTPATNTAALRSGWEQLERYVARRAYFAIIGYPISTFLTSANVVWNPALVSPIYGWDLSEVQMAG